MRVLVAGCGWLGTAIARRLVADGAQVVGIRRDAARAEALRDLGVAPLAVDLADPAAAGRLPAVDAIVACQAAGGDTPESYRAAYVEANRALLAAAARTGARVVYTGSTGVFGQRDGEEVDEASPPSPAGPTARILVEAEGLVREAGQIVVRLSGLYGPGRAGMVDRVRSGRLALGPGDDAWMNFCHLDDAGSFVLAALARGAPGAVYHGSDAAPARRREVVEWVAARIGIPPPRADATPGPSRRIRSEATRATLGVELAYPSFREGFGALVPAAAHPE